MTFRAAALIGASALGWTGATSACGDELGDRIRRIENAHYAVVFKTMPDPIAVGTHFSIDFAVCPQGDLSEKEIDDLVAFLETLSDGEERRRPNVPAPSPAR